MDELRREDGQFSCIHAAPTREEEVADDERVRNLKKKREK